MDRPSRPQTRIEQDLRGLGRLEAGLGLSGAAAFFEEVARADEAYELGVASDGASVLVSYNPRTRRGDFRARARAALAARGLPLDAVDRLLARIGPLDASLVLGLELRPEGVTGATLYLEQLSELWGAERAEGLALELAGPLGRVGGAAPLYIVAVDLPEQVHKVYRLHPGAIEQWRLARPLVEKRYRLFDYAAGEGDPAGLQPLDAGGFTPTLFAELAGWMGRTVRVTSIGRRGEGPPTVYWCASGPGVP